LLFSFSSDEILHAKFANKNTEIIFSVSAFFAIQKAVGYSSPLLSKIFCRFHFNLLTFISLIRFLSTRYRLACCHRVIFGSLLMHRNHKHHESPLFFVFAS